ncbi:MAG: glycosyltransferase family 39 protein [Candidatus Woesearchaeota archaeon]|jgi:4-amino-4-deoxy-L-arabinose transferase-like glycosyltransferase|nr:glycosyltransferase family 39 protein [Candidatus Woesearchaeota archaeon]
MNRKIKVLLITALFLFTLYLWTLPFQKNRMPYGEVDAGSHFTVGDYMAETDKSVYVLPYFIDKRYGTDNFFSPHHLWYHPPYHVNFAIMQIFGGERILPVFLFNAILCSIIVLISYFVLERLFGFWVAFLSSLLFVFSMRDIMVFLWGQWPQQISYFYTPLVLYVFYKYVCSYLDGNTKPVYAYIFAVLLGVNFYLHPVGSFHTIVALVFFSLFLLIKERKIPFSFKHISVCALIFLLMLGIFPLQTASVFGQMGGSSEEEKAKSPLYHDFGSFFSWFAWKELYVSWGTQPEAYFDYDAMNGGYWTLPLLLIGLFFILFRRERKDLLLLSFLLGVYFMIHMIVFMGSGRPERSLAASAHVFYPLAAVGLLSIPFLLGLVFKIKKRYKNYIKYVLIGLFVFMVFSSNFKPAYSQLKGAYEGIVRITPTQYKAAEAIRESSIPMGANITGLGILPMVRQQKMRWMWFVSHRYIRPYKGSLDLGGKPIYVMVDYSDLILLRQDPTYAEELRKLQAFEEQELVNGSLVVNHELIRVYKLG